MTRYCQFSRDRAYRYTLWREWDSREIWRQIVQRDFMDAPTNKTGDITFKPCGSFLTIIGLNPSTADETRNDPTILRCIDFAKRWGFPAMCMLNLFAYRATNPEDMKLQPDPIGRDNDRWLHELSRTCVDNGGIVLAAWGAHGIFRSRGRGIRQGMETIGVPLHVLGLTKGGFPIHPMARGRHRVPNDAKPVLWESDAKVLVGMVS